MKPLEMIRDARVVPATFELYPDAPEALADVALDGNAAVPMRTWLQWKAEGHDLSQLGAIVQGDDDVHELKPHLAELPFVALYLPKFTDGRIYTHARRLRGIWGYQGAILAYGDVLRDQLVYLHRVGVDVFYMAEGSDLHGSLASFSLYSHFYQYNSAPAASPSANSSANSDAKSSATSADQAA